MAYPSYRQAAASCYDTSRKQWFMFGGCSSLFTSSGQTSEVWTRSQAGVWTLATTSGTPSVRVMVGSCYMPSQDQYLIACGRQANSYVAETYWYNPATGAFTAKAAAPQSRAYFGNALWLPSVSKAVIHGGYNGGGLSNTIVYTPGSNTWADLGTLSPGPGSTGAGWWAYNSSRGKGVYFGGDNLTARQNKTWEFDPSTLTFTDRTTSGTKPSVRRSLGMWYDPVVDAIYVHGGDNSSEFGAALQDLWKGVYNNGTGVYDWTQMTTPVLPSGPTGRSYYSVVGYDPDNACGYIWGGEDNASVVEGQGWRYNSATDKWRPDLGFGSGSARPSGCNAGFGG